MPKINAKSIENTKINNANLYCNIYNASSKMQKFSAGAHGMAPLE